MSREYVRLLVTRGTVSVFAVGEADRSGRHLLPGWLDLDRGDTPAWASAAYVALTGDIPQREPREVPWHEESGPRQVRQ